MVRDAVPSELVTTREPPVRATCPVAIEVAPITKFENTCALPPAMVKTPRAWFVGTAATYRFRVDTRPLDKIKAPSPSRPVQSELLLTVNWPPETKTVPMDPLKRPMEKSSE